MKRRPIKNFLKQVHFNLLYVLTSRNCLPIPVNDASPLVIQESKVGYLPDKVWVYWEGSRNPLVEACIKKLRELNPSREITVLNPESVQRYVKFDLKPYAHLSAQLKSDIIRLSLLTEQGGIWIDASVLCFTSLDWVADYMKSHRTKAFGFYRKHNITNYSFPVIETWFLATEPQHQFFSEWRDELVKAISQTPEAYIESIRNDKTDHEDYFQNIGDLTYLCAYVAGQVAMRRSMPSIVLIDSDQNAFYLHSLSMWRPFKVLKNLVLDHAPEVLPHLIKLTRSERWLINKYYSAGKYKSGSLMDRFEKS